MAFGSDITETIGNVGGRTTQQGYGAADEVRKQYTGYERDDESDQITHRRVITTHSTADLRALIR